RGLLDDLAILAAHEGQVIEAGGTRRRDVRAVDGLRLETRLHAAQRRPFVCDGRWIAADREGELDPLAREREEQLDLAAASEGIPRGGAEVGGGAREMRKGRAAQRGLGTVELDDSDGGAERDKRRRHVRSQE